MTLDLDLLCAGALAHPVTLLQLYLHLFNKALLCLTDMTRLARCASVLLVSGCTSTVAGVIHWVWIAAVGLWAACLGIAGAADGCAVGTAGIH